MSNAAMNPAGGLATASTHDAHANHHDPHLAHHFDTPEQQYISAKLGMWIFLGTEILMFGGLFCAYSVYRHNHPEVFEYAHHYLDKILGAINTLVLITSSLTMAWAVRSSQLGQQVSLRWLMVVTILGGYVFLGIKSVEYHKKWEEAVFVGSNNMFRPHYEGKLQIKDEEEKAANEKTIAAEHGFNTSGGPVMPEKPVNAGNEAKPAEAKPGEAKPADAAHANEVTNAEANAKAVGALPVGGAIDPVLDAPPDPNAGGGDAAQIHPTFVDNAGLAPKQLEAHEEALTYRHLQSNDQKNVYTFFAVYFVMTGLHGVHVLVGMGLITWVLLRSMGPRNIAWGVPMIPASMGLFIAVVGVIIGGHAGSVLIIAGLIVAALSVLWALIWVPMRRNLSGEGEFGPTYFTPVDLVGLYWHLVDLIWIFLFPLLYLIH